jgi:hypothetical protein
MESVSDEHIKRAYGQFIDAAKDTIDTSDRAVSATLRLLIAKYVRS